MPARCPRRRQPAAALLFGAVILCFSVAQLGVQSAGAASPPGPIRLTLLQQPSWEGPGADLFTARIAVTGSSAATLGIRATVYPRLTSRSAFAQSLTSVPAGEPLGESPLLQVASLPHDPAGGIDLSLGIRTASSAGPPGAPALISLGCADPSCPGVYPLRLTLVDLADGSALPAPGALTTHVVWVGTSSTNPLAFALVLPLMLPALPADAQGDARPAPSRAVAELADELTAIDAPPVSSVPLTVRSDAATFLGLTASGRSRARQALDLVDQLAGPSRQLVTPSFVPVDADELVGSGLPGELADQIRHAHTMVPAAATASLWPTARILDRSAVSTLATSGIDRLVLSPSSFSSPGCANFTCSEPFSLATSEVGGGAQGIAASPILAVETDAQLGSDAGLGSNTQTQAPSGLVGGSDPGLAAADVLSDLALVHFEEPSAPNRGVVLVVPSGSVLAPDFLSSLLSGLIGNPTVHGATLDGIFTLEPGANNQPRSRTLGAGTSGGSLPARAIRSVRADLASFSGAVADPATLDPLDQALLSAEASTLHPAQQAEGVKGAKAALDRQAEGVRITRDTLRLTAAAARVPITVLRTTPYTISTLISLSSDKLLLTPGPGCTPTRRTKAGITAMSCPVTLSRPTTATYFQMRARTQGSFPVTVALTTPDGRLVLDRAELTVRSMSTSLVAVVLSLGAGAVLIGWWVRTWRRSRRRPRHAAGAR